MSEKQIPMLGEHEAAKELNTTNPSEYTPTAEEKKIIKHVNKLFDKAKAHKKKYDEKWLDNYKMFRGRQWKEQRPSYRHSEVINLVFQNIQSMVPILTDSRPRFEFLPQDPSDREFAQILDQIAENDWHTGNWLYKLTEVVYDAHFYGSGLGSMEFNPDLKQGLGGAEFKSADPFYCFPDPQAYDVNERANYFIYAEPVDINDLKKKYPDKAKFIKPDVIDLVQGDKTELHQVRFKSPVDNKTVLEGTSAYDVMSKDQVIKIICYLKDDDFDEEEKRSVDPETGEEKVEYIQKLKYPNGRKICMANGILLEDGPIPYDDGLFPFAKFSNYILPREFWGISEVEQLESPQKIFNKLISFSLDVLTLMGNPIWIVDNTSGIDTDNLFNRPGLIIEKEPNSEVRREEGVHLQPYVLQMIDRMKVWFDEISGSNDVTRGVRPEGVTAASAINQLQEAAQTRIRQKSRNLDAFLQNIGKLYLSRVLQFYTAPRIIRVTNDENAQKYFKFSVDTVQDEYGDEKKVAKVRHFSEDPNGNLVATEPKEYILRGEFDVRVSMGSSLPFAKAERVNLAKMLFEAGAIDEPELLKAADYPNWEAVWERVKARREEQMQAQMAAQQGGGVPPQA